MAGSYPELDKSFKNTSTVFGFRHYETNVNESFCEKKNRFGNGTPKTSEVPIFV